MRVLGRLAVSWPDVVESSQHPVVVIELDVLLGSVTTLAAVPLAWWLANKSNERSEAKAERASLEKQFDDLVQAVTDLQATVLTSRFVWEHPTEVARWMLYAVFAAKAGYASAQIVGGSKKQCGAVAGGAFLQVLSRERRDAKVALEGLQRPLNRVASTAVPLLRHASPEISASTERLLSVAVDLRDPHRLEDPLRDLTEAVRGVLSPPPTRWTRLRLHVHGWLRK